MPTSPADGEKLIIEDIRRTYAEAERSVIEKMAAYIKGGKQVPNWQERKLSQVNELSREVQKDVIGDILQGEPDKVKNAVQEAYENGQDEFVNDMQGLGKDVSVKSGLSQVDEQAVKALSQGITKRLNDTHFRVLREAEDQYRRIVGEASRTAVAGTDTRLEAAQKAMNKFANNGVVGFRDANGRNWSLSSYTEMATRSATGRAAINGHINRARDNDHDLMMVGDAPEECEMCRPWEGKVVSISGDSEKYPPLAEARSAGLFHPNCTHSLTPYIHNITETEDAEANPKAAERRRQQRYNERGIRKWKRRKAGAMTEETERKAKAKITEWQKKQQEFIERTGRYRKYNREATGEAR